MPLGVENFKLHFTACYVQVANRGEVPEGTQGRYVMTPKMLENLTGPPKSANQPQALAPCRRDLQAWTSATQGNEGGAQGT